MRVSSRKRLSEKGVSILKIEVGSNVDKPHAVRAESMQSKSDEDRFKQTTLNDFVSTFPPLKASPQLTLSQFKGE